MKKSFIAIALTLLLALLFISCQDTIDSTQRASVTLDLGQISEICLSGIEYNPDGGGQSFTGEYNLLLHFLPEGESGKSVDQEKSVTNSDASSNWSVRVPIGRYYVTGTAKGTINKTDSSQGVTVDCSASGECFVIPEGINIVSIGQETEKPASNYLVWIPSSSKAK